MTLTKEDIGKGLGILLILGGILGLPYLSFAFIGWDLDPQNWGYGSRFFCVAFVLVLTGAYFASMLPDSEDDKPLPLFDDQTGARIHYPEPS